MKKIILSVLVAGMCFGAKAQDAAPIKKQPILAVNFMLNDFATAQRLKQSSLGGVFADKNWARFNEMSYGLSLQYITGLTSHVDFSGTLAGSFVKYPFPKKAMPTSDGLLVQAEAGVNAKLLTDKYVVVPFASAGLGTSMYKGSDFAAYIPLGIGFQIDLGKQDAYVFFQGQYKVGVTANAANHFMYSLGFAAPLKK
jgi:OOP family OmpA-OmpF porin